MQKLISQLLPLLFAVLGIIAFTFGIILFAYILFYGILFVLILVVISRIRQLFFPKKRQKTPKRQGGRIIDSDDWKVL